LRHFPAPLAAPPENPCAPGKRHGHPESAFAQGLTPGQRTRIKTPSMNEIANAWNSFRAGIRSWKWPFEEKASGLLVFACAVWPLAWLAMQQAAPTIYRENGPMENTQALCLLGAVLLFVCGAVRRKPIGDRVLFSGLALFCGTFFLLEFDVREYRLATLNRIFNGPIRNLWLGLLWAAAFTWFFRNMGAAIQSFVAWLCGRSGTLFALSGVFWVAAAIVDKLKPFATMPNNLFAEELLEMNAAALMFVSAVLACLNWRKRSSQSLETPQN
jgi:hypothetical protein